MALKWAKYLHQEARRKRKEILWLNLDETSVPVVMLRARGTLKKVPRKIAWRHQTKVKANLAETRMCFTLVAIICSDPNIQPLLPQVMFISEKHATWSLMREIWANLPPNVFVKRKSSGWSDKEQHRCILQIIGKVLEPYSDIYQPVLIFDAVKLHLDTEALEEMFIWLMWYLVVPKEMTFLCQPLDAHVFGLMKTCLRAKFNRTLGDPVPSTKLAKAVKNCIEAIEEVLNGRDWTSAFDKCGYGMNIEAELSPYFKHYLQWEENNIPQIVGARPTPDELRAFCWPGNFPFDEFAAYLAFPKPRAPVLALPAPAPKQLALPAPPPKALPPVPPSALGPPTAKKSGKTGGVPPPPPLQGGAATPGPVPVAAPAKAVATMPKAKAAAPVSDRIHEAIAKGIAAGGSSSSSAAPKPPSGVLIFPPSASASSLAPANLRYLKSQALHKPDEDDDP